MNELEQENYKKAYTYGFEKGKEKCISLLEKIEEEKWHDAEHCSCLAYSIGRLRCTKCKGEGCCKCS